MHRSSWFINSVVSYIYCFAYKLKKNEKPIDSSHTGPGTQKHCKKHLISKHFNLRQCIQMRISNLQLNRSLIDRDGEAMQVQKTSPTIPFQRTMTRNFTGCLHKYQKHVISHSIAKYNLKWVKSWQSATQWKRNTEFITYIIQLHSMLITNNLIEVTCLKLHMAGNFGTRLNWSWLWEGKTNSLTLKEASMLAHKRFHCFFFGIKLDQCLLFPIGLKYFCVNYLSMWFKMCSNICFSYIIRETWDVNHLCWGTTVAQILSDISIEAIQAWGRIIMCVRRGVDLSVFREVYFHFVSEQCYPLNIMYC